LQKTAILIYTLFYNRRDTQKIHKKRVNRVGKKIKLKGFTESVSVQSLKLIIYL